VQAAQEDTYLPVGWLRPQESGQGGAEPYSHLILGVYYRFTCLAWAALQLPGVEVEEVSMVTGERRPRRNPPPDQRPDPNEEFRRALERETDLSLRADPERRRLYRTVDLPRSGSPGDDRSPSARRHDRDDVLTWNGETLTLIGWSQRTGIRVETLLRRCRKGWSVEQVLTTPPGEDR
jgi:hypothetical protein